MCAVNRSKWNSPFIERTVLDAQVTELLWCQHFNIVFADKMRCEVENNWLQSFNERFHTKKQSRKPIRRMFQMISWLICIFNIITHTRESQTGFYLSFSTGCVWALCFCNKILHSADATVKWDHPLTRGAAGWHILVGSRGRWWASSLLLHDRAGSVKRLWWDRGCCLAATLRRLLMRLQRRSLQTGSFFRMLIYLSSSPFFWLQVFGVQVQKKTLKQNTILFQQPKVVPFQPDINWFGALKVSSWNQNIADFSSIEVGTEVCVSYYEGCWGHILDHNAPA